MATTINHNRSGQGMNWIRPVKRLAIYMRDGFACVYCGAGVEDEVRLTLDHLKCQKNGGNNDAKNLITCCLTCNSSRGARSVKVFVKAVANYRAAREVKILNFIKTTTKKHLNLTAAHELLDARGGFTAAVKGGR